MPGALIGETGHKNHNAGTCFSCLNNQLAVGCARKPGLFRIPECREWGKKTFLRQYYPAALATIIRILFQFANRAIDVQTFD